MTTPLAPSQLNDAVRAAAAAATDWASSTLTERASLLRALAEILELNREELVRIADEETHLGTARLQGELSRTTFQLKAFADEAHAAFEYIDDPLVPGPPPAGHPPLLRVRVPVGPVAMFSASNFPFAFSVLGGDTASALAAGCPVVVKPHPGHPRLSTRVHQLAVQALERRGLPPGLLGMIDDTSIAAGVALIRHPLMAAAAFTGSVQGGLALESHARSRPRPIPFYGELGSVNPVIVLPDAVTGREQEMALLLAQSITNGSGQFCTSPGLILIMDGPGTESFVASLQSTLAGQTTHAMLTPGIRAAFDLGVARLSSPEGVTPLMPTRAPEGQAPIPFLGRTSAATFLEEAGLHEEVFGPAALIIDVNSAAQVQAVLEAVGGSLTATVWGAGQPSALNQTIVRAAAKVAGRVLFAGVPTGVAVTAAQHHGGPYPSSTQPFTTSVGLCAMDRFLRPVAFQDAPAWIVDRQGQPV